MPVSTVSLKISRLEKRLAVTLLKRTTRRLQLTPAGNLYYGHARKAVDSLEQAEAASQNSQGSIQGPIRILVPMEMGRSVLSDLVASFLRAHPRVEVDLVLANRFPNFLTENIDLAVCLDNQKDSSVISRRLGTIEMALYASPQYLKGNRDRLAQPDDLLHHRCVVFGPKRDFPWDLHRGGDETHSVPVTSTLTTDDMGSLIRLTCAGMGIGTIPTYLAQKDVRQKRLVRVLPRWFFHRATVHLLYPQQPYVSMRVRALIDHLVVNLKVLF